MDFIDNGQVKNKYAVNITCRICQNKFHYENDCPDNNTETDTGVYASRQSISTNVINEIIFATVMIQEGIYCGEFYGYI